MGIYVISFLLFFLAFVGLAAGVLAGRGSVKGSCGGLNQAGGGGCSVCTGRCADNDTGSDTRGYVRR